MGKHRAKKHESTGPLGTVVSTDSLKTLPEEEKLGLKRGLRYTFNQPVTADAFPLKGGRIEANFKAGQFMGSIDAQLKFIGEPVGHKKDHGRCQFFLYREDMNGITFSLEAD